MYEGLPSMTLSASSPPTPIEITPKASTIGVWLSVPTKVSANATCSPALFCTTCTTGDIFSRLIWCMMPLPGGTTLTLSKAYWHQLIKWKRSSLRRSSMARFFSKAFSSKPACSTASEWSTISWVGTIGFTFDGSPPCSAMASRRPAKSTNAVWPKISWQTTRAGYHGKSRSCLPSICCLRAAVKSSGGQRRTKFSHNTFEQNGSLS